MSFLRSSINAVFLVTAISKVPITGQTRQIKRWVAPTLRELRRRAKKLGPQEPQPRSGFIEWNYNAEIYAFSKRLHEEFQLPLLQTAFTQHSYAEREEKKQRELGIEESDLKIDDNRQLADHGHQITKAYVKAYLKHSLPKVPTEGHQAISDFLLSTDTLSHIAMHLGMKDLILSDVYPPATEALANALLAVIGALEKSSGMERAFLFVRDFVCTQLNQRDLLDFWPIDNAEDMLNQICEERKWPQPEPRLLGDCGKNTLLSAYQVGIYVDKKLIGKGFGEDIPTAIKTASIDSLQGLFGIRDHMRPFDFTLHLSPKDVQINQ